jgi:hypothetical protein
MSKFGRRGIAALKSVASKRLVPGTTASLLADGGNLGEETSSAIISQAIDPQTTPFSVKISFLDASEREFELWQNSTVFDLLQALHEQFTQFVTMNGMVPLEIFTQHYAIYLLVWNHHDHEDKDKAEPEKKEDEEAIYFSRRLSLEEILIEVVQNARRHGQAVVKLIFKSSPLMMRTTQDSSMSITSTSSRVLSGIELELAFMECMFMIATGRYFLTEDEAMHIGGLLIQVCTYSVYQPCYTII